MASEVPLPVRIRFRPQLVAPRGKRSLFDDVEIADQLARAAQAMPRSREHELILGIGGGDRGLIGEHDGMALCPAPYRLSPRRASRARRSCCGSIGQRP